MAIEVNLQRVGSGYNLSKINSNFQEIETALSDSLSRTGFTPNHMETDLDMNGNDLLNIGLLSVDDITVDGESVLGVLERAEEAADEAQAASATAVASAATASAAAAAAASIVSGFSAFWLNVVGATNTAASWILLQVVGHLTTRTAIKALVPTVGMVVYLSESGREGNFIWREGNYSTQITADTATEGIYLKAASVASSAGAWVRDFQGDPSIYWFGAVASGSATDATVNYNAVVASLALTNIAAIPWTVLGFHFGTNQITVSTSQIVKGLGAQPLVYSTTTGNLFNVTGYDERCEIENLTIDMTGAGAASCAIRLRNDLGVPWGARFKALRFQNCYGAIKDVVGGTYSVDVEISDVQCRMAYGTQIDLRRTQGIIVLRDVFVDNTVGAYDEPMTIPFVTWDSVYLAGMIGLEMERLHVVGQGFIPARTFTLTIATPGVVTRSNHGLPNGAILQLSTTGALPTGLAAATNYYVVNSATNTFQLSLTPGGAAINTTGAQSGVHSFMRAIYTPAARGIVIIGTSQPLDFVWGYTVRAESNLGAGVFMQDLTFGDYHSLEAFGNLGYGIYMSGVVKSRFLNIYGRGAYLTPGSAASSPAITLDDCSDLQLTNWGGAAATLDGLYVNNSSYIRAINGYADTNLGIAVKELGTSDHNYYDLMARNNVGGDTLTILGANSKYNFEGTQERGTWVPDLQFAGLNVGMTYATTPVGTWVRSGPNTVKLSGTFTLSAKGSSTGNATITGNPFTAKTLSGMLWGGSVSYSAPLNTITDIKGCAVASAASSISLYTPAGGLVTDAHFQNATQVIFEIEFDID